MKRKCCDLLSKMYLQPVLRQCFVTMGPVLNMMGNGMTVGFGSSFIAQIKASNEIKLDDEEVSWILSIIGIALIVGVSIVPLIIHKYGRKVANLISPIIMVIGWLCISTSTSFTALLIARFLLGLSSGFTAILAPMLIGEYTSPRNRGVFLGSISFAIFSGILFGHSLGSLFKWQTVALICGIIPLSNIFIIFKSPESPSYLASKGRYEECRRSFHWLRGLSEEEELENLIKSAMSDESNVRNKHVIRFTDKVKNKLTFLMDTIRKKEFYKPIIVMIHIHTLNEWCGATLLDSYASVVYRKLLGDDLNIPLIILSTDTQRIITSAFSIIIVKKFRRRVMLATVASVNISAYLLIAVYNYTKVHQILPFDHPAIGVVLLHLHTFSIGIGMLSLPNVIGGEVFPLKYKSFGGMISLMYFSLNVFINIKTAPFLFENVGLHGAYCIYAAIIGYSLIMSMILLPETKDKTLLDIEEDFKEKLDDNKTDENMECLPVELKEFTV